MHKELSNYTSADSTLVPASRILLPLVKILEKLLKFYKFFFVLFCTILGFPIERLAFTTSIYVWIVLIIE